MENIDIIVGKEFPKKVIPLIDNAKNCIDVVVFDWRWYPDNPGSSVQLFNQSFLRASKRGVKIRAISNMTKIVEILKQNGIDARNLNIKTLVHVKLIIIDNEIIVLGSHNFTESAFQINFELSVILYNPENKSRFVEFFNNLLNNYG